MTEKGDYIDFSEEDYNILKASLSKLIKMARFEANLSVHKLAAKANVSYTVIYDLENKNVLPKFDTINKLAKALNLVVDISPTIRLLETKLPFFSIAYYPRSVNDKIHENNIIYADKKKKSIEKLATNNQLEDILIKKGLHSKDIEEVKNFIEFKLSQHNK